MSLLPFSDEVERLPKPEVGEVIVKIPPGGKGRVEFGATTWNAEFAQSGYKTAIEPGEKVNILARRGNTLLIMPLIIPSYAA